jgi:hypothetical protein
MAIQQKSKPDLYSRKKRWDYLEKDTISLPTAPIKEVLKTRLSLLYIL